jgi:glycosyltransferase involved in cell wall biosynthesis
LGKTILIIPAYNEGARLGRVLTSIAEVGLDCEVVVVNDGSKDDTAVVSARHGAKVVSHPFNLGYGAALQTGYKFALASGAEIVLQMDADGQHDPAQFDDVAAPVRAGEFDIVIGSRFLEASDYQMEWLRSIGRGLFSAIARLAGLRVSDPTSGFQAMNRHVLEVYTSDFFPTDYPDVDVLLAAYRHGLRVGERPVAMAKAERASTLHSGLRPLYYVYKMLLSTWSNGSASNARRRGQQRAKSEEPTR